MHKSLFDEVDRIDLARRITRLGPDATGLWGTLTAPQMVTHLIDQMSHCLGDRPCAPVSSFLRNSAIRFASIYLIPWPKGRIKGPADAFVTNPGVWAQDVEKLLQLLSRFGSRNQGDTWPDHALFGRMTGRDWGVLCYKHFDHHLRQFGA